MSRSGRRQFSNCFEFNRESEINQSMLTNKNGESFMIDDSHQKVHEKKQNQIESVDAQLEKLRMLRKAKVRVSTHNLSQIDCLKVPD